jgi:hypothetical protein
MRKEKKVKKVTYYMWCVIAVIVLFIFSGWMVEELTDKNSTRVVKVILKTDKAVKDCNLGTLDAFAGHFALAESIFKNNRSALEEIAKMRFEAEELKTSYEKSNTDKQRLEIAGKISELAQRLELLPKKYGGKKEQKIIKEKEKVNLPKNVSEA